MWSEFGHILAEKASDIDKISKGAKASELILLTKIKRAFLDGSCSDLLYQIAIDGIDAVHEMFEEKSTLPVSELKKQANGKDLSILEKICILSVFESAEGGFEIKLRRHSPASEYAEAPDLDYDAEEAGVEWLTGQVGKLTTEHRALSPVQWACENRYLPRSVTSMPGPYRIEVTPYLEEILECLSPESPVREIAVMKGVQIAATVGLIENYVGYLADVLKGHPAMLVTADNELAEARIETNIIPMLQESDLMGLITASDTTNKRKTGATKKLLQFEGCGYLMPLGAQNPNKFRSTSIQDLMRDEIDAYPQATRDGDPMRLTFDRTSSYETTRKVLDLSTPSLKPSNIEERFNLGDKREYRVPCKKCGEIQKLEWLGETEDGKKFGIAWELDEKEKLIPGSSRYVCKFCFHRHINEDKTWMLAKENGARWVPTDTPARPNMRSYHISALYSPVGMQSWDTCVLKWLEAWDVKNNRIRTNDGLKVFNNNVKGVSFEEKGSKIRLEAVSAHRRMCYKYGEIPNEWCEKHLGQKIQFLTCQVDVQKRNLAVAVFGWTRGLRSILVDYWRFEVDEKKRETCEELTATPWGKLREVIEDRSYLSSDGRIYKVTMTLIDSNYARSAVVAFCADYDGAVHAIEGVPYTGKIQKQFYEFTTSQGDIGFRIIVDFYKDRIAPVLRREWSEESGKQSAYSFNAPMDITTDQLKEFTRETRKKKSNEKGQTYYYWHRTGDNELWDLLVYGHAAVEIMATQLCLNDLEMESVDWDEFWGWVALNPLYSVA